MAAINNSKNGKSRQPLEWEDPALGWDEMRQDIFAKIEEEDPLFFKRPARRRGIIWFWFCLGAALLGGSTVFWLPPDEKQQTFNFFEEDSGVETSKTSQILDKSARVEPASVSPKLVDNQKEIQQKPIISIPEKMNKLDVGTEKNRNQILAEKTTEYINEQQNELPSPAKGQVINISPLFLTTPLKQIQYSVHQIVLTSDSIKVIKSQKSELPTSHFAWMSGFLFSSSDYEGETSAAAYRNQFSSPIMGVSLGAELVKPISEHSDVVIGLDLNSLHQKIDGYTERQYQVELEDALVGIHHLRVGSTTSYEYMDTIVIATEKNRLRVYNQMYTLQLRTAWRTNISLQKWQVQPEVGVDLGRMLYAAGKTFTTEGSLLTYDQRNPIYKNWQFQSTLGVHAKRAINPQLTVQVGYQWSKQWNNGSRELGVVWKPAFHKFSFGLIRQI